MIVVDYDREALDFLSGEIALDNSVEVPQDDPSSRTRHCHSLRCSFLFYPVEFELMNIYCIDSLIDSESEEDSAPLEVTSAPRPTLASKASNSEKSALSVADTAQSIIDNCGQTKFPKRDFASFVGYVVDSLKGVEGKLYGKSFLDPLVRAEVSIRASIASNEATSGLHDSLHWLDEAIRSSPTITLGTVQSLKQYMWVHFRALSTAYKQSVPSPVKGSVRSPSYVSQSSAEVDTRDLTLAMTLGTGQVKSASESITELLGNFMQSKSAGSLKSLQDLVVAARQRDLEAFSSPSPSEVDAINGLIVKFKTQAACLKSYCEVLAFTAEDCRLGLPLSHTACMAKMHCLQNADGLLRSMSERVGAMTMIFYRFSTDQAYLMVQKRVLNWLGHLKRFFRDQLVPSPSIHAQLAAELALIFDVEFAALFDLMASELSTLEAQMIALLTSTSSKGDFHRSQLLVSSALVKSQNSMAIIAAQAVRRGILERRPDGTYLRLKIWKAQSSYSLRNLTASVVGMEALLNKLHEVSFGRRSPEQRNAIAKASELSILHQRPIVAEISIPPDREVDVIHGLAMRSKEVADVLESGAPLEAGAVPLLGTISYLCDPSVVSATYQFGYLLTVCANGRTPLSLIHESNGWRRIHRFLRVLLGHAIDNSLCLCEAIVREKCAEAYAMVSEQTKSLMTECINRGAFMQADERRAYKLWVDLLWLDSVRELREAKEEGDAAYSLALDESSQVFSALTRNQMSGMRPQVASQAPSTFKIVRDSNGMLSVMSKRSISEKSQNKFAEAAWTDPLFQNAIVVFMTEVRAPIISRSASASVNMPAAFLLNGDGSPMSAVEIADVVPPCFSSLFFPGISYAPYPRINASPANSTPPSSTANHSINGVSSSLESWTVISMQ